MNQESVWGSGSWIYTSTCFLTALIIIIMIITIKWWNSHLHSLRDADFKLSKMKDELHRLELLVTSERRKRWLKSVDVLQPEVSKILVGLARRDLDNCRWSYYFGKEAAKKLETTNQLLRAGENLQRGTAMSLSCLCPMEDPLPGMTGYCMEVFDFAEDKDDQSLFFGVWGMRGVGKTALLRLVRDAYTRFRNLSFNHVLFIEADTRGTMNSIQRTIAVAASGSDWATISHDEQWSRVNHISWSLERGSFLLLLDNVPENFDLAAAGLPIQKPGRRQKVVFTTRSQTVCDYMVCATGKHH